MSTGPDPADGGMGYGFTKKDAERIARTVRRIERQSNSRHPLRGRFPIGTGTGGADTIVALCGGGGIAARTTAANGFQQPGTAQVTLLDYDGTYLSVPVATLTLTAGGSGYTNGNGYALSVSGGGTPVTPMTGTFDVAGGVVVRLHLNVGGQYLPGVSPPTLGFPGAGGSGATATAALRDTVTCANWVDQAIGNNHYIAVAFCADGTYKVVSENC